MGVPLPTTYSFSAQEWGLTLWHTRCVRISFDSSKLAANLWYDQASDRGRKVMEYLCVWDLPSGTLLHSLKWEDINYIQWSWTDQYLLIVHLHGDFCYLNAETFQEEVLGYHDDHFQDLNHLYTNTDWNILRIRLSSRSKGPVFSVIPSHLLVDLFSSQGDQACILSRDK